MSWNGGVDTEPIQLLRETLQRGTASFLVHLVPVKADFPVVLPELPLLANPDEQKWGLVRLGSSSHHLFYYRGDVRSSGRRGSGPQTAPGKSPKGYLQRGKSGGPPEHPADHTIPLVDVRLLY